jgi:nickel/cobalt transporter (NiCoT) family protein
MQYSALPNDLLGLALAVLLLGVKHGFDADHLAAIDAMTQHNAQARPRLARQAGLWFALGHGAVVSAIALGVAGLALEGRTPAWLAPLGAWVSIAILLLLAALNLGSALRTPGHQTTPLVGWRSGLFARQLCADSRARLMSVGALFALSFDTVSQALLFSVTAAHFGGWQPALLLAAAFTAGMVLTDGANGWCLSRLLRRADATARVASRVMALAIAGIGLLTAGLGLALQLLPSASAWAEGKQAWFGAAIVAVIGLSYGFGQVLARSRS